MLTRTNLAPRRGFTLIELVVVLIVIGIIAAIALVTFNTFQDRAGDRAASESVRQVTRNAYFISVADEALTTQRNADLWTAAASEAGGVAVDSANVADDPAAGTVCLTADGRTFTVTVPNSTDAPSTYIRGGACDA